MEGAGVIRGQLPVVFVVPDTMGSTLAVDGLRIWVDRTELARGGIARLAIEAVGVEVTGLLGSVYGGLIESLGAGRQVVPFPWDWRASLLAAGAELAELLRRRLAAPTGPVGIVAHGAGGLVVQAAFCQHPELQQQLLERPGSRVLLLGTPSRGLLAPVRLMTGDAPLVRLLARLDLVNELGQIGEILASFPGLLETLPGGETDYLAPAVWREIAAAGYGGRSPRATDLATARQARDRRQAAALDPGLALYVAGRAPATPIAHRVASGKGRRLVAFLATAAGDGRVAWAGGAPDGVPIWYLDAVHGELASSPDGLAAIAELLDRGTTDLLPRSPGVDADPAPFVLERGPTPDSPPGRLDLEGAALGLRPRRPGVDESRVQVGVTHGSLASIGRPLAVGHYDGDAIVGAEALLDRRLGGALSDLHERGQYVGPDRDALVLLRPGERPAGAVVVRLGPLGRLGPGGLEAAFAQAALRYAFAALQGEAAVGRRLPSLPLAALLVGSGDGGIPIADSVRAIVRAVVDANDTLRLAGLGGRVQLDDLQLVELYEHRAVQAAWALERLAGDVQLRDRIHVEARLRRVPGGRHQVALWTDRSWWSRLQIRRTEDGGALSFLALTGSARSELHLLPNQKETVDRFVERAIGSAVHDPELGRKLFDLLVPTQLRERTPDDRNLVLIVDESAASYPWELLDDRSQGTKEPPAIRAGLVRQLVTAEFRADVRLALEASALVVGDPPSSFPELPAARREAERVAGRLEASEFEVEALVGAEAGTILAALRRRPYRMVHLAGHGVYRFGDQRLSGMLLGDGVVLTPAEVERMSQVPDLVFINCCHLGRIETGVESDLHRLAGNLGTQLIRMGVRAVVAAGWAVHDGAAATFAREFYRGMLAGEPFGETVLAARRQTWRDHPEVNTWGAYQCYGDPDFVLRRRSAGRLVRRATARRVSRSQAIVDLENLAHDAEVARPEDIGRLEQAVEEVDRALPNEWRADGELLLALGRAYAQVGGFRRAIDAYEESLGLERADCAIEAVEQLANLEVRWAVELASRGETVDGRAPLDLIADAERRLESLLEIAATVERLCLLAGVYKRRCQLSTGRARRTGLRRMAEAYFRAHELALKRTDQVDPYPLLNWLAARGVLYWLGDEDRFEDLDSLLEQCRGQQPPAGSDGLSFWDEVTRVDITLTEHLIRGDLDAHREQLVAGYTRARRLGASAREFGSVLEHLGFLRRLLSSRARARQSERRAVQRALAAVRAELRRQLDQDSGIASN